MAESASSWLLPSSTLQSSSSPSPSPSFKFPVSPHCNAPTYGITTQTGTISKTTPNARLGTTGLMNQIFRDCKPGDAAAGCVEFTPTEHVSAPVAMLRMTGVSLPFDFERPRFLGVGGGGGYKRRRGGAILVDWLGGWVGLGSWIYKV